MSREEYINTSYDKYLYYWSNLSIGVGCFVVLSLAPLDYFASPVNFKTFLYYRITVVLFFIIIYFFNRKKINRAYQSALSVLTGTIVAAMIAVMIAKFDGHQSVYFAGFILLIIYVFGLIPFTVKIGLIAFSLIYLTYLLPILIYDTIINKPFFISSNIFILSCAATLLLFRYLSHTRLINEFGLQYDLAEGKNKLQEYSGNLEELVVKRTMELSASEQRHRELFENANDGIAVIDKNGTIVDVNKRFCDIHGFGKNVLAGTHFGILEVKDNEGEKEERMRRIQGGESFVYEATHYKRDGSTILFEVSSKAMNIGGELYIQSFYRDITEKKQLQGQLLQSQKMESVGTLAGGIAHDFNNIVAIILGHISLLNDCAGLDDKAKQRVRIIENSARKAGQIVSKLMSFSRKASFEILPVNLNNIIKDTVELCETMARSRKVAIKMETGDNIPCIHGDSNQMEQVLMNLFVNAMDAMPDGGTIIIGTEFVEIERNNHVHPLLSSGKYILMKVTDTGTGIPEEIKDKIFNPFFTTKEQGKGTGLGLAMVYGIVKEHKGVLNVKSKTGKGTTFEIYLPPSDAAIHEIVKTSDHLLTANARILVVDDEKDMLNFMKEIIEGAGYKLLAADNPYYALEIFGEVANNIDLVITDIVMPLMDGRKLIKHFKTFKPAIKAIAISGYDAARNRGDADIDAFISKPFEKDSLLSAIRKVLGAELPNPPLTKTIPHIL